MSRRWRPSSDDIARMGPHARDQIERALSGENRRTSRQSRRNLPAVIDKRNLPIERDRHLPVPAKRNLPAVSTRRNLPAIRKNTMPAVRSRPALKSPRKPGGSWKPKPREPSRLLGRGRDALKGVAQRAHQRRLARAGEKAAAERERKEAEKRIVKYQYVAKKKGFYDVLFGPAPKASHHTNPGEPAGYRVRAATKASKDFSRADRDFGRYL